mgnify:CR=1 FL=1
MPARRERARNAAASDVTRMRTGLHRVGIAMHAARQREPGRRRTPARPRPSSADRQRACGAGARRTGHPLVHDRAASCTWLSGGTAVVVSSTASSVGRWRKRCFDPSRAVTRTATTSRPPRSTLRSRARRLPSRRTRSREPAHRVCRQPRTLRARRAPAPAVAHRAARMARPSRATPRRPAAPAG